MTFHPRSGHIIPVVLVPELHGASVRIGKRVIEITSGERTIQYWADGEILVFVRKKREVDGDG